MLSLFRPAGVRPAGLAAAIALGCAGGAVVVVAACGSGSEGASYGGPYDSGVADSGHPLDAPAGDTFSVDSGGDAGDAEAGTPTTALFVQASPSLPDVRLCWFAASQDLPFPSTGAMPGSNYPGIPLGGVAAMNDASDLAGGFGIIAIDAENLARIEQGQSAQHTCQELICGPGTNQPVPCLRYNLDYWTVNTGGLALKGGADNVVAVAGCLPAALDPSASAATCGASWTALNGNLHADILQLQGVPPEAGASLGVQAAQLSPALAALVGDAGGAVVSFGAQGSPDASVVATLGSEGQLSTPAQVSISGGMAAYGQLGFAVDVPGYDGGAGHLWMSLAEAQQLVDPTQDPALFFGQPRPYLVAVLGDPASPHPFTPGGDAGYDGKGLHVVVAAAPTPPTPSPDQ